MADSVHQDVMPIKPMQSMAGQTGVGMEKEEHGLIMSTGFQVLTLFSYDAIDFAQETRTAPNLLFWKERKLFYNPQYISFHRKV